MKQPLLIEIGVEELPPSSVSPLSNQFGEKIVSSLGQERFKINQWKVFATPRRFAVICEDVETQQEDQLIIKKGPSKEFAYDAEGNPTKAAIGFAKKCGVDIANLDLIHEDKKEVLSFKTTISGKSIFQIAPELTRKVLSELRLPKRMRWGEGKIEFIRPILWINILHGKKLCEGQVFDMQIKSISMGHSLMSPSEISIPSVNSYPKLLKDNYVIADYDNRRNIIQKQIDTCASQKNLVALKSEGLLDEVTSLVEWPNAVLGSFPKKYLALPKEVIISSIQEHQKYFPLMNKNNELTNFFVTISNIDCQNMVKIKEGNERVVRPRLEDALFFYNNDKKMPMKTRLKELKKITYIENLGTLFEKTNRLQRLSEEYSASFNCDSNIVSEAALLSRCDLTTSMVREFPKLQGKIGAQYLAHEGEKPEIFTAIEHFYHPRHASDCLPSTSEGLCISLCDKIDSLVGIIGIGLKPSGDKDPYAMRRSAIGIIRILVEKKIDLSIERLITSALNAHRPKLQSASSQNIQDFIFERLKHYYKEKGVDATVLQSIGEKNSSLYDHSLRVEAIQKFIVADHARDLISSNKRIKNILKQHANMTKKTVINERLLTEPSEINLVKEIKNITPSLKSAYENREYTKYLELASSLKTKIDCFFEQITIISDDQEKTKNRICLLQNLNQIFQKIAAIEKLDI